MNQIIQENTFLIIGMLFFIIFLMMGAMIFILYRLLAQKEAKPTPLDSKNDSHVINQQVLDLAELKKKQQQVQESFYCIHHKDEASVGGCLICEEVFCEDCLIEHDGMHFCKEHFRIFANHKWKQITDVKTTPDTPEEGLFIHDFKRKLWSERNLPTFVMTHYKINIENDYIESFIQLNVREEDAEKLSEELKNYKAQHSAGLH
jgi:hypothetical protein